MLSWFPKKISTQPDYLVSALLSPETVLICSEPMVKEDLLTILVPRACEKNGIKDFKPFLDKLLEREKGMSTTLDTGLSLPHARIDGLRNIIAALAIAPGGILDSKEPNSPTKMMFVFFSPDSPEFNKHLQLLRSISCLFKPALIEELLRVPTAALVLKLIRRSEA